MSRGMLRGLLLVVVLLCLDSLVKIPVSGNYLHAYVLVIVCSLFVRYITVTRLFWTDFSNIARDRAFVLLFLYTLCHSFFALDFRVYLIMFSYMLLFAIGYIYVQTLPLNIDWRVWAGIAVIILCLSGFFQYALMNVFDVQLELRGIDESYFLNKGDLGSRMRGFYLEPNWFGISLYAWGYLLYRNVKGLRFREYSILFAALLCLILSNNRLVFVFVFVILGASFLSKFGRKIVYVYALSIVVVLVGAYVYFSFVDFDIADRSATARIYTSANVVAHWLNADVFSKLWGHGFSNWSVYSNELGFAVSNYTKDQSLTRRDNAEIYVYLFEMGLVCFLIFAIDIYFCARKSVKPLDFVFVLTIYLSGLFYPMYQFLFYLLPYMVVRREIFGLPPSRKHFHKGV